MKEFFENLKKKRLANKVTLDTIHQKTRLSMDYLQAIEAGEMHKLPESYSRIYLRRYAREIGLNPDEVMRDYDLLSGKLSPAEANIAKQQAEGKEPTDGKKPAEGKKAKQPAPAQHYKETIEAVNLDKVNSYFWPVLLGVIVVVSLFFVYRYYASETNDHITEIKEIPIGELMERVAQDSTPADTTAEIQPTPNAETPQAQLTSTVNNPVQPSGSAAINLELRPRERVWIQEIRDQRDTTDYILNNGANRTINARSQVELMIGRPDALEIWLNGRNLGSPGDSNQVARLTITAEGIVNRRVSTVSPDN